MRITFDTITAADWPRPLTRSRQSERAFRVTPASVREDLVTELERVRAKNVRLLADLKPSQVRDDGWPFADAKPRGGFPGTLLSFEVEKAKTGHNPEGRLWFPCDRYSSLHHNLRATGLTLEALRAVDRYGATYAAEQYAGFGTTAIVPISSPGSGAAAGGTAGRNTMHRHEKHDGIIQPLVAGGFSRDVIYAAITLLEYANRMVVGAAVRAVLADPEEAQSLYRLIARTAHPDHGGDRAVFEAATAARDLLVKGGA